MSADGGSRGLHRYLQKLAEAGGSDLHLTAGRPPAIRVQGDVQPIPGEPVLDDAALRALLRGLVDEERWRAFMTTHDIDFAHAVEGVGRFRANYFEQELGAAAVFRLVPEQIIPFERLGLPPVVATLADLEAGLVLVTGPTGSGKSTTLAAIIDLINRRHARHVVTIEDPLEFVHRTGKSVMSHREVKRDTGSFATALRAALRQDADVVLVGEMRDPETIALALEGASMGVLVFGTLHTSSAAKTVDRIIDVFPADQQPQTRLMLADTLTAVVAQILCRRKGGGRVAAHEILMRSSGVAGAIREGKATMLQSIIGAGRGQGMQTMDDALDALVERGAIEPHEAYLKASDKKRFRQAMERM